MSLSVMFYKVTPSFCFSACHFAICCDTNFWCHVVWSTCNIPES